MGEEVEPEARIAELLEAPKDPRRDKFGDPIGHDEHNAEIVKLLEGFTIGKLLDREPKNNRERDLIGLALRNKVLAGGKITAKQYDEMRSRGINIPLRYKPETPEPTPEPPG